VTPNDATLLAQDKEARRQAQLEFQQPLVLEAGAGTGKTTALVARILAWSLGEGWAEKAAELEADNDLRQGIEDEEDWISARVLEGLVAITFTEAAAAEMAERAAQGLSQVASGEEAEIAGFDPSLLPGPTGPEERSTRARALLGALDRLTVRTIHSYCWSLLVTHPMEAGLHPELEVDADASQTEAVAREVVEAAIKTAYAKGMGDPLTRLAARGQGPQEVVEILTTLSTLGVPPREMATDPLSPQSINGLVVDLTSNLRRVGDAGTEGLVAAKKVDKAIQVLEAVSETSDRIDSTSARTVEDLALLCGFLAARWDSTLLDRLKKWEAGEFTPSEGKAFGAGVAAMSAAAAGLRPLLNHLKKIDPLLLDDARRALEPLLAEVERRLRARGLATFQSLLVEARDLLENQPLVRARERRRIDQLLVDEFQDTDRIQCDIVRLLALEGPAEERPGLFVVGDPKQSIYGWRNADLEAYEDFLNQALEEGGHCLPLLRNFRSAPSILAEVDRVMPPVMLREPGLQPRFESLVPSEKTRDKTGFVSQGWAPVEYWVSWRAESGDGVKSGPATLNDVAALLEAEAVAADIRRLHDDAQVPWSDFGILLRGTGRLETFLGALRDAGVPFLVGRDKQYYRKREIIEAAAVVRAVLNPSDHLALLTFLRSAGVGVPDAALIPLWSRQFPDLVTGLTGTNGDELEPLRRVITEATEDLPGDIPGLGRIKGWEVSLEAAMAHLARLRRSFAEDPPDHFIERLRQLLLLEATEAARYLGPYRLANLERFFRRLESTLEECGGDYQAIQRTLRRSVQEAVEAEEALPKEAAEEAVQVVTIHSAKGLEFAHVYLVQLHAGPGSDDSKSVDIDERWRPGKPFEYTLFGSPTPGFFRVIEQRQRVAAAERVRTLYVAMTRAKERLVLVGKWPEIPTAVDPLAAKTYLELIAARRPALPGSLGAQRDQGVDGAAYIDAHGTRWRFPGYLRSEDREIEPPASPSWLPTAREVESASSTLVQKRHEATLHMARPFSRAASEEAAERLRELLAEEQEEDAGGDGDREMAMAVGTAIHRLFETWDLTGRPAEELALGRRRIHQQLAARLGGDRLESALGRADEILGRLESGSLLQRFVELGPSILGREVPVLLPPGSDDQVLGFVSGTIDLLYRDPKTGDPVIVDYKTDRAESDDELAARAEAYAAQEKVYARAIQQALALPALPRTQLWFLWADRAL
jgi:ATP-dependent helicase/nuclease subunit A